MDNLTKKVIKYDAITGSTKDINYSIEAEVKDIKIGKFDDNSSDDLLLLTEKEIWLLNDFSNRSDAIQIVKEDKQIQNLFVLNMNDDNFVDITYTLKDSKIIKSLRNDFKTDVDEINDSKIIHVFPNPVQEKLQLSEFVDEIYIFNLLGREFLHAMGIHTLDVDLLQSGQYVIKSVVKNKIHMSTFHKL